MSDDVLWRDFYGLHSAGWKRDVPGALSLVADAFEHPAKVRPDLAQKIFGHALAEAKGSPRIDWEEVLWFKNTAPDFHKP